MWCCFVHRRTHLQCFSISARPPVWMEVAHLCSPGPVLLRCCKPGSSCNGTPVFCLKDHTIRPTVHPTFFLTRRKHSHIYINICPTRCNTKQSIYYSASPLYVFRVSTTPTIRSTQNCNYSLWYWSYFLCYLGQ